MKRFGILSVVCALGILGALTRPSSAASSPFDGVWRGTLSSRNYAPLPVTLILNQGDKLTGAVSLISPCLRSADLEITTEGSNIRLAGTDAEGDTITFNGSLDRNGTHLVMRYILNASSSGRCQIDDGAGTLAK
jgi:hypothetical protein